MKMLEPIAEQAWNKISEEALTVLRSALSARKVVNIEGPKGMDFPAVPTGRLDITEGKNKNEVQHGIHRLLPLLELKAPFTLDIREVETIARGARDVDLDPVDEAAAKLAKAEDRIIYEGYKKANIPGIATTNTNRRIKWPEARHEIPAMVTEAMLTLQNQNIDGPFSLILNEERWHEIHCMTDNYPLKKQLANLLGGEIILNTNTRDCLLVSERGGDFYLTLGQDISLGYEYQEYEKLRLFLLESFTFMIAEPRATVVLE